MIWELPGFFSWRCWFVFPWTSMLALLRILFANRVNI